MRIRFVSRLLAVAAFLAAAGAADAQSGIVTGLVRDADSGQPLQGVQVQVMTGTTAVGSGATAADGRYRIANVPAGTYAVTARSVGYAQRRVEGVSVTSGQTTTLDISMSLSATVLNPVTTTGTRGAEPEKVLDSPNSISLVSSERIAERPAATVTDHLKGQPGLSISNGGIVQANIVSRGFNNAFSTSMLMLQDYRFAGVPSLRVNVPFLFTGTGEDIDRIEVLQGPASALYGPNSGNGVLHVITKSPFQSQGTSLTLDGGERSLFRVAGRHAGVFGNNKFGYKLSGEFFRANDFEYNDPNEPATYSATDTRIPTSRRGQAVARDFDLSKIGMEARLDWRPNEDTEAITTFGYSKIGNAIEITTTFGAAQAQNWSYTNFQQRFRHKKFFAQVFYNASNSGNADANDDNGTFYLRSGIPVVDKSTVLVGQVQQGLQLGSTKLTAGLDVISTTPQTEGTIMGRNEDDDGILETGAYLQVTQPLSEKFDFLGAVRADANSRIEGTQFSPRAAILYKATPTQNFRFTFNRAFGSPASFSMFLDQWSGQTANLGPAVNNPATGNTEVRIFGNPSKEGWQYNRSCTTGQASALGLCMRNNAYGAAPGAIAGSAVFPQLMGTLVAPGTPLALALAAGIPGLPAPQVANIAAGLGALVPTNTQAPLLLRNVLAGNAVTPFSSAVDLSPLGANFSNTWEIGYKGIIGDKMRLAIDYWYQIRPADPTTQVVNGDDVLFMDPAALGAYLGNPANGVVGPGGLLANNGVPLANHGAIVTGWVTQIAGIPAGTLDFANDLYDRSYLVFTYQNASGQVDVRGVDVGFDYLFNDMYSVEASYSNLSRNVFADATGASAANPLAANTPKHRATLTFRRVDEMKGMSMEVRGRYMDAFPVNSGVLNSYNIGTPTRYPAVPVNAFLDAGFSWRLPVAQNIRWSLNIQNLLNNEVQSFAGVAPVGRLATTRVQYTF
ncbi:MAG: TonB-dependent receptor [Gemmatimonadaceae bacterium]|nr:TonB-dependent receptor [Gemmatimonadaceae bacterium]